MVESPSRIKILGKPYCFLRNGGVKIEKRGPKVTGRPLAARRPFSRRRRRRWGETEFHGETCAVVAASERSVGRAGG